MSKRRRGRKVGGRTLDMGGIHVPFRNQIGAKMKNATYLICGIDVGTYTNLNMRKNTYADLMGGKSPSKCKGRGSSVRNALIEKIKADGKNKNLIEFPSEMKAEIFSLIQNQIQKRR